jgi:hypothetical protein
VIKPIVSTLTEFNVLHNHVQYIMLDECEKLNYTVFQNKKSEQDERSNIKACKDLRNKYFGFITKYDLLTLSDINKMYPEG